MFVGQKVESVEEAVREAQQLKRAGRYWFRGQSKGWSVRSSFTRVDSQNRHLAKQKIARYNSWIKNTRGLEYLAENTDEGIAVAQHYGLPTNFVDFTTEPKIAGFFASEKASDKTAGDLACIICLDVQDFEEFWQQTARELGYPPPELLKMTVPELWRLEAQHGCFLFCPYDDVERIYNFHRIVFPNAHRLHGVSREDVYPEHKSHLEVLLDQYFMNEELIEAARALKEWKGHRIVIEAPKGGCSPEIFPKGLPEHTSWADRALRPWIEPREETFKKARTAVVFRVIVRDPHDTTRVVREISKQLRDNLFNRDKIRSKLVKWHVELEGNCGLPRDFESRLSPRLAQLWDGLRRLPHSDEDISLGVGMCVAFAAAALGEDFRNPDGLHWERWQRWERAAHHCLVTPVPLHFGSDDGSYSRSYASAAGLAAAIRPDVLSYVAERWDQLVAENVTGLLLKAWTPKKLFDFGLLTPLFAREIAPYQVLTRDTAIFYSPARLTVFGLP